MMASWEVHESSRPFSACHSREELGHYLESLSEYWYSPRCVHWLSSGCSPPPQPPVLPFFPLLTPQQLWHQPPALLQPWSPPRHPCGQRMTFCTSGDSGGSLNKLKEVRVTEPGCCQGPLPSLLR